MTQVHLGFLEVLDLLQPPAYLWQPGQFGRRQLFKNNEVAMMLSLFIPLAAGRQQVIRADIAVMVELDVNRDNLLLLENGQVCAAIAHRHFPSNAPEAVHYSIQKRHEKQLVPSLFKIKPLQS